MAVAGALIGGALSWGLSRWIRETDQQKADREALTEQIKQEHRNRPKTGFEPSSIIVKRSPIGRHGEPSQTTYEARPGAFPEIPRAPYNPPLFLPILGAIIGFLWGYLKPNRQSGLPSDGKRFRRKSMSEPEPGLERRCKRCGELVPDGAGVKRFVNQVHSPGNRYGPSSREIKMFLCESCGPLATDVSRIFWWTLAGFFVLLLIVIVFQR